MLIDPDKLPRTSLVGRLARLPLRLVPSSAVLRVASGPNRGMRWRAGSSVHGCWLGTYERLKTDVLLRFVRPGMTVYDIGANAGYYTLLLSRRVGPSGRVFAFEPLAENVQNLLRHIQWNGVSNCRLIQAAVARSSGLAAFECAPSNSMGRLGSRDEVLKVPTVSLDELVDVHGFPPPEFVKMDIEGAEGDALEGARRLLRDRRIATWFVSLHGAEAKEACDHALRGAGYAIFALDGSPVEELRSWSGDEIYATPRVEAAGRRP